MEIQTQEARIILAIEALQTCKSLNRRSASILYKVPYSTLTDRMAGRPSRRETKDNSLKLTELEEEVIIRNILDMDARGFAPRPASVEDMANYILESRGGKRVGMRWAYRFIQRRPELKTRFNRVYNFQRVFAKIPSLLERGLNLCRT
jgi:hypothetical protein